MHGFLVGAALAHAVNQQAAVPGNIFNKNGSILVGAQPGRVNQAAVRALPALAHVDRRLALAGQALLEEVPVAAQRGRGVLLDTLQLGELMNDFRAIFQLVEILLRVLVLLIDPGPRLRTLRVLEPTVGILDLHSLIFILDRVGRGWRRWRAKPHSPPRIVCS